MIEKFCLEYSFIIITFAPELAKLSLIIKYKTL